LLVFGFWRNVAVQPQNLGVGKKLLRFYLNFLRAGAYSFDSPAFAFGAIFWQRVFCAAMVTEQ